MRQAPEPVVPASAEQAPTLTPEQRRAVQTALEAHHARAGALLPVLHAIQEALGFVPAAAVPVIAHALNLSRAEVHGVISFYPHFRSRPCGRHVLYLCRAEACQAMGARVLEAEVKRRLGIDFHETTADGAFTLEPVYCLGNCACAPSLMIDRTLHGRVDAARFAALLDEVGGEP
jgi:formate dehydrogenase subunit gamma